MCYLDLVVLCIIGGVAYLVYMSFKKDSPNALETKLSSMLCADALVTWFKMEADLKEKEQIKKEDKIIADQVKLWPDS